MRWVYWEDNKLKMIDQRRLPGDLVISEFDTVTAVADAVTSMVVRGAPAIGAAAAYGMALAGFASPAMDHDSLLVDLSDAKRQLDAARPTAVNLSWATQRLFELAQATVLPDMDDIRSALLAEADALANEDVAINRRIGFNGAELIEDGANLLHHCNTGRLATVDYGTALGIVYACQEQGKAIHVWVDETRPRLQGSRLTAWELQHAGVPMHLIADSAAGHLLRTGKVDAVIFGADRVAANGDVANKIGTYKLAVVAAENDIPVYSAVPTPTIDMELAYGDLIPIEERGAAEVAEIGAKPIAPPDVPVYNPAFDITPARYLTAIVTEEGVCYPPFEESLAKAKSNAEERIVAEQQARKGANHG